MTNSNGYKDSSFLDNIKKSGLQKFLSLGALIILYTLFSIFGQNFFSSATLINILDSSYYIGFLAIGVTFVIIPSAITLIRPNARGRVVLMYVLPFMICAFTLAISTYFACRTLYNSTTVGTTETWLIVLLSFFTILIFLFMWLLAQYLWEIGIAKTYDNAKAGKV